MSAKKAAYYIEQLQMIAHPEGGYYKETYKAPENIPVFGLPARFKGDRSFSTAIYYLLEQKDFSAFHRIKSDECWHFYAGGALYVHVLELNGTYSRVQLGNNLEKGEVFQFVVPAGAWFAAEPAPGTTFALVGCTVAPGFDFADFELAEKEVLLSQFAQQADVINRCCR
ncbi:cupin domain-containing protein [Adhaeribacter aquaticus]|uniref:cupin domain-containing protein n=1 Tax=Adhaeribacter aquaticus TaxID=299567 RepID=UPI000404CE39|nr:cupin domain-containing protein [Adhaeribacter aquaticus]